MNHVLHVVRNRYGLVQFASVAQAGQPSRIPAVHSEDTMETTVWMTETDAEDARAKVLLEAHGRVTNSHRYKRAAIRCCSTNVTYRSAAEAARILRVPAPLISMHLNDRAKYPTAAGYVFERVTT